MNKTDTALASCELEVKAVFLKPESGDPLGVFVNMKIPGPCPSRKLEAGTCVVLTKSPNFSEPRFPHLKPGNKTGSRVAVLNVLGT